MRRDAAGILILLVAGCVGPARPLQPAESTKPISAPIQPALTGFSLQGAPVQGGLIRGKAPDGAVTLTLDGKPVALTGGRFLIGLDRDAAATAILTATVADGRSVSEMLAVQPRAWRIEELPIPRGTSPSPEFQNLRAEELAQITAARAIESVTDGWQQTLTWPVTGRISGMFGAQRVYRGEKGSYHSGTDIARPTGTPVAAPADGVVVLAADHPFSLEGNLLMIDHGLGLNSSFLHLSRIDVRLGDRVRRGDVIGAVGMTGRATGPHLHWSLRWRDARVDPLLAAGPMPGQPAP